MNKYKNIKKSISNNKNYSIYSNNKHQSQRKKHNKNGINLNCIIKIKSKPYSLD